MSSAHLERQLSATDVAIRVARAEDVPAVICLDERITGIAKPEYWRETFEGRLLRSAGVFLVAESAGTVVGFIFGEVRAWEFGSPPCGWIFAIGVDPDYRLGGAGTKLFEDICRHFKEQGVSTVRTMLARDDNLIMSFFRSQCMTAGPFIQLDMALD
jgi:ribosomal protein S18 acetylase RimI-like enzyme